MSPERSGLKFGPDSGGNWLLNGKVKPPAQTKEVPPPLTDPIQLMEEQVSDHPNVVKVDPQSLP